MSTFAAVEIGNSLQQGLDKLFAFLPNLIGALVILVVGYIVARVVRTIVVKLLDRARLDAALRSGKAGGFVARAAERTSAARITGLVAFWFLFLGTLSLAASALQIAALTDLVAAIAAYLPNVIAAVVIFLVASAIAAFAGGMVSQAMGETASARILSTVVPVLVMAIAGFMILNQLQIAPEIVTITYTALLGAAALGLALAFGLGGRETAAKMMADAYAKSQADAGGRSGTGRFAKRADDTSATPHVTH